MGKTNISHTLCGAKCEVFVGEHPGDPAIAIELSPIKDIMFSIAKCGIKEEILVLSWFYSWDGSQLMKKVTNNIEIFFRKEQEFDFEEKY